MGGGGAGEVQKKNSRKGKLKEFDNEKKFLQLENSPPPSPLNFSTGPSLSTGHTCDRNRKPHPKVSSALG